MNLDSRIWEVVLTQTGCSLLNHSKFMLCYVMLLIACYIVYLVLSFFSLVFDSGLYTDAFHTNTNIHVYS